MGLSNKDKVTKSNAKQAPISTKSKSSKADDDDMYDDDFEQLSASQSMGQSFKSKNEQQCPKCGKRFPKTTF